MQGGSPQHLIPQPFPSGTGHAGEGACVCGARRPPGCGNCPLPGTQHPSRFLFLSLLASDRGVPWVHPLPHPGPLRTLFLCPLSGCAPAQHLGQDGEGEPSCELICVSELPSCPAQCLRESSLCPPTPPSARGCLPPAPPPRTRPPAPRARPAPGRPWHHLIRLLPWKLGVPTHLGAALGAGQEVMVVWEAEAWGVGARTGRPPGPAGSVPPGRHAPRSDPGWTGPVSPPPPPRAQDEGAAAHLSFRFSMKCSMVTSSRSTKSALPHSGPSSSSILREL